jgi:hypothetical protein
LKVYNEAEFLNETNEFIAVSWQQKQWSRISLVLGSCCECVLVCKATGGPSLGLPLDGRVSLACGIKWNCVTSCRADIFIGVSLHSLLVALVV